MISLCRMVQSGKIEPFDIDFDYVMGIIKKHYPGITNVKDFCLDAQALNELSGVLESQNKWIAHKSSTLYKDPFMLSQQLMRMDIGAIADAFLKSWHPLVEMEQISERTLVGSLGYWGDLIPIDERWKEPEVNVRETEVTSRQEAYSLGLISEEGFVEIIEKMWMELGGRAGSGGSIDYWDWIGAETYDETVHRAYLTVFMVGYGYADMTWDRLLEETVVIHNPVPDVNMNKDKISLPVLVDYEEWKKWREA